MSASVSDVLSRTLNGLWDIVVSFIDKFETEELKEVVLYENAFFNMSTPTSLITLASKILNIGNNDSVLEICSGTATFPVYALFNQMFDTYTGIEINYNVNDIAILKASLLGDNYTFILNNALTYKYTKTYDKIFSNYPFTLRGSELSELPKALEKFVAPNNSLVLSKMASPTFRSAVVNTANDQAIVATGNLYIIELDESKVNPYFVQAFFDSELGEETLNYASGGSAVKTISAEAIKSILIPLPPLEEQNAIAVKYQAALDEYEILQRKMQRLLERKRTLLNNKEESLC